MEFMLDTINIEYINSFSKMIPLAGITSNPTIIKQFGKINFFEHMNKIRSIIGMEKSLHIQVVATNYEDMIKDAESILKNIDKNVYIKVPVFSEGLKVIQELKYRGVNVTATAIYTKFHAYLAIESGADYIAPYFNRMENLGINAPNLIHEIAKQISHSDSQTKILSASFKNIEQINKAIENGSDAITINTDLLSQAFSIPYVDKSIIDFKNDWETLFGVGKTIHSL